MSYLVLARKYRPQTFSDVVGQRPVVKTLRNSLLRNRVAHAMLFSGVRGVGKTTLARIMAKAINCEGDTDDKPCNQCRSCREITAGQSLDLHEIDGASNRGIQEIRELKEKIRFMPASSRYKIIIIDEVHMLTTEAFNALLKTLEEPPEHVYFMFATTEIHKIPITILSRCQRYELKRVSNEDLSAHFLKIAEKEGVTIDPEGLSLIIREAEGSVRDGLSLFDQILSFGDTTISLQDVVQVLGLTDRTVLLSIAEGLLQGNRQTVLKTFNKAFDYGMDIKRFSSDLLECMRTLLLIKIGGLNELIDLPKEEIRFFTPISDTYSFETLHMKFDLLLKGIEEIRNTSQPRLALETTFLKIIEAGNIVPVSALLDKIDTVLNAESREDATAPTSFSASSSAPSYNPPHPAQGYGGKISYGETDKKKIEIGRVSPHNLAETGQGALKVTEQSAQQTHGNLPHRQEGSSVPPFPASATANTAHAPMQMPPPQQAPTTQTGPQIKRPSSHSRENEKAETAAQQHTFPQSNEENGFTPHHNGQNTERGAATATNAGSLNLTETWERFLDFIKNEKRTPWMAIELRKAEQIEEKGNAINIRFRDDRSSAVLNSKEHLEILGQFILDFFKKKLTVHYIFPAHDQDEDRDESGDSPSKQRQLLANDPLAQMTAEIFNGQVGNVRLGKSKS